MKLLRFLLFILFSYFRFNLFLFPFPILTCSFSAFSMEEETVFELKREKTKKQNQTKKKKALPLQFKRKSFSYSKDFLIFNEKPAFSLQKGTVLKVNIPYSLIASFHEEFPVYAVSITPLKAILSGKIKAIKNTNKALINFDEIIFEGETAFFNSFPILLDGGLKEALFKDIALNFFESLPSVLALALKAQIPQNNIHFINTDLTNKAGKLSRFEKAKNQKFQYLEIKNTKLLKVIIK